MEIKRFFISEVSFKFLLGMIESKQAKIRKQFNLKVSDMKVEAGHSIYDVKLSTDDSESLFTSKFKTKTAVHETNFFYGITMMPMEFLQDNIQMCSSLNIMLLISRH